MVKQLPNGKALNQIKEKGYADKYLADRKPIHLIGIECTSQQRQIVGFDLETITCG